MTLPIIESYKQKKPFKLDVHFDISFLQKVHEHFNMVKHNHFYNAITPKNCFVKRSHKYDVYLVEENKAHLN